MEKKPNKELYVAPVSSVLELDAEGVICLSGGIYPSWSESPI